MTDFRNKVDQVLSAGMKVFGESVEFHPASGGIFIVDAVFNNSYHTVDPSTQQAIEVTQPNLGVNLNDVKFEIKQGDAVVVRHVKYRIEEYNPDGQGGAQLFLHKASLNERIKDTRVR